MNEETRSFAAMLTRMEKLTMKIGTITAVTSPTVSCKLGGDVVNAAGTIISAAPIITGISHLKSYSPTINDVVVIMVDEKKQLFIVMGNI